MEELFTLLKSLKIQTTLSDERCASNRLDVQFHGALRDEQQQAANALLQNDMGVLTASTAFGKTVVASIQANRFPVLLTERTEHLETLASLLSQRVKHVFVMKGGMDKKQRRQLADQIASIPTDQSGVILATGRYLGEGFDDERLDPLFLTLPISWRGTLTQYAGRLHRLNTAKIEVVIYDYVDFEVPVLAKMHKRRRTGYKALGYEIELAEAKKPVQLTLKDL